MSNSVLSTARVFVIKRYVWNGYQNASIEVHLFSFRLHHRVVAIAQIFMYTRTYFRNSLWHSSLDSALRFKCLIRLPDSLIKWQNTETEMRHWVPAKIQRWDQQSDSQTQIWLWISALWFGAGDTALNAALGLRTQLKFSVKDTQNGTKMWDMAMRCSNETLHYDSSLKFSSKFVRRNSALRYSNDMALKFSALFSTGIYLERYSLRSQGTKTWHWSLALRFGNEIRH
jgi:hypothetical protein